MILTVDTTSGSPPYEQIRSQVTKMIASGVLAPGDRLPTIAQLSADLGLANGTVARAYRELEGDRLIVSHRRRGSFVAETAGRQPVTEVRDELDAAIERFVLEIRQLGVNPEVALRHLTKRLGRPPT